MRYVLAAALTVAFFALLPAQAAKAVFSHMIVGNLPDFTLSDWESDIRLAQSSRIDAFALNVAAQDSSTTRSLDLAFQAADALNFSLFFSFDYLAQGPWPADRVISLIQKYSVHKSYFRHDDDTRPLVSTFEGPGNAGDWHAIKVATNAFFVPNWSSVSAAEALNLAGGVADGLFSWDAWPEGNTNMTTGPDKVFLEALRPRGKVYMMAVSPWFFTNLPGFGKNWLWRGDELWDIRWQQVLDIQADFVQILTWNDYGESHYIGPVREKELGLFTTANAPVNYVRSMTHDGWRKFLPFYIEAYKTGRIPNAVEESVVATYRTSPALACPGGGTKGNNGDFGQNEVAPEELMDDNVYYSALLNSDRGVTVTVSIGGKEQTGILSKVSAAGPGSRGVYMGAVPFGGNTGDVVVAVLRDGKRVATAEGGKGISAKCENNVQNWNAVVV
ncbi:glycoside hydrolase family 71 protein [Parathielavia appendiculata]|uniref:Glycoside hydrolase family 71 protein n=1 Tax=Parathielavia appendiculata TaxID=2587402 RepID=A0AAN6U5Y7_9PEZI|nr:glycoside hydrolase family 71 protein [Parathielavia appendiculata]